jgi:hypothetical protein
MTAMETHTAPVKENLMLGLGFDLPGKLPV